MGGFFGVASKSECSNDLFFGTDYQSHLGTQRGGLAVKIENGFKRSIHDIRNAQFRSKFDDDIQKPQCQRRIRPWSDLQPVPGL